MHAKLSGVPVEEADDHVRAADRQADAREPQAELADLLRRLPRVALAADRSSAAPTSCCRSSASSLSAVPMALTALAVWLESGRPVIYRQERVGQHGRVFTLFKFRSMRIDAEGATSRCGRSEGDNRVTTVGRFIRLTRLDELPQFWNVLRGDMSFVGPRPERPYFVEQLAQENRLLPRAARREAGADGLGAGQVSLRLVDRGRDREAPLRPLLRQAPLAVLRPDDRLRHGESHPLRKRRAVTPAPAPRSSSRVCGARTSGTVAVVAHNVSTRYLAYLVDAILGLVMLPFNLAHLGMAAYGLWMLTTSFTAYFAMLDLGYGGALVRFVAQYRARRDARALNEVLSTSRWSMRRLAR